MPRGAAPGERRGGRAKGTPNRYSSRKAAAKYLLDTIGMTPLEVLVRVMQDKRLPVELKLDAAAKAAPYVHPRLQAVTFVSPDAMKDSGRVQMNETELARAILLQLAKAKTIEGEVNEAAE